MLGTKKKFAEALGRGGKPPANKRPRRGDDESPPVASTSSASTPSAAAAAAASWSTVLVKVCDVSQWRSFKPDDADDDVLDMDASALLKALKHDDIFGGDFEGAMMSTCTVNVLKGALEAGQKAPTAAEEADGSKFVELEAGMTVRDAAKEGNCKGGRLFVRVRLPVSGTAAAGAAAAPTGLESELLGAELRPSCVFTALLLSLHLCSSSCLLRCCSR